MHAHPKFDLTEATRLTREGRIVEAMTAIRRALGGPPPTGTADDLSNGRRPGPAPAILDVAALSGPAGGAWTLPAGQAPLHPQGIGSPPMSKPVRALLGRLGQIGPLAGLARPARRADQASPAPLPDGARFDEHVFANEAGSRTYKLYVPSGYAGQALPLVVMLHGCTQSPDDFAAGTRMNELAEEQTFLVAYPAQSQAANPSKCWNWFNAADQERGYGEPSLIAGITQQVITRVSVDSRRVYVAGLSAGGAAAAVMGSAYPDLFAAVGIHSGLACGAAADIPSAFKAMRQGAPAATGARRLGSLGPVPTIVFHGDCDTTVNPVNGSQIITGSKPARDLRTTVSRGDAAGGISYTRTVQADENGRTILEHWDLHGVGHAWSGGSSDGSYTEPRGPDASREMMRFFLQH